MLTGSPDHYGALGVHPTADHATIRAAYRRLVREVHPDVRPDDPEADEAARRLNAAWTVLSDSARRASYDRLRAARRPGVTSAARAGAGTRQPAPPPAAAAEPTAHLVRRAYSRDGVEYRDAFHRACLRVGVAVTAFGTVLLLVLR
jgi:curved DNA-binding protein CbpA